MYYNDDIDKVLSALGSTKAGLSADLAKERLAKDGPNKISSEKPKTLWKMLLGQFSELMVLILIGAGIFSWFVGEGIDAAVIFFVVGLNVIIGVFQEYKAERAVEALKQMMAQQSTVIRDEEEVIINSEDIVVGDVMILEEGSKIPADARIIDCSMLSVDESVLTGESVPHLKNSTKLSKDSPLAEQSNMLFMGTTVMGGRGMAVVVATGMRTEFGKIAGLTSQVHEQKSPLQLELDHVAKFITKAALVICVAIVILASIRGMAASALLKYGISVGVAAVPEGLPATLTIALAFGVRRMAKRKAIVRKLSSVETLGSTTVICTDKTGTLTKNQMTVRQIFVSGKVIDVEGEGYEPKGNFMMGSSVCDEDLLFGVLRTGLLCNNAVLKEEDGRWKIIGDPTEGALVVSAEKAGLKQAAEFENFKRVYELPFSSKTRMMMTVNERVSDSKYFAYLKGSPEAVMSKCSHIEFNGKVRKLTAKDRTLIKRADERMCADAMRVLALAYKTLGGKKPKDADSVKISGFVFQGLQAMLDPPRVEVKDAVVKCKQAGIRIFVITGDHPLTARAIAQKVGIASASTRVITGTELDSMDEHALSTALDCEIVFARMTAENKMRIVSLLMKKGEIVAVTGDGVNDAPALKKANIGVAMGIAGTDVTKEASKIILEDDNFATIVNAVEEGRSILDNLKTFVKYILIGNAAGISAIFISLAFGLPAPLTALQILWFNVITETIPSLGLTKEPAEHDVMQRKPRNPRERILSRKDFWEIALNAFVAVIGVMCVYVFILRAGGWHYGVDIALDNPQLYAYATTVAFSILAFFQYFNAFNIKSPGHSVFFEELFNNRWLIVAIFVSLILQVAVINSSVLNAIFGTSPLNWSDWFLVIGVASSTLVLNELFKLGQRILSKKAQ